jgi:hypothetical protein
MPWIGSKGALFGAKRKKKEKRKRERLFLFSFTSFSLLALSKNFA